MKKTLAVLAGAFLLLTACTNNNEPSAVEDPKGALVSGLRSLLESETLTQTITVQSDTASLVALGEGDIDEETAGKILSSSVQVSATQADNPEDASSLILVNIAGNDDLEVRFVEGDLYLRADVASILETFGQDPSQLDAITSQVQGQAGFEWVDEAMAGEWLVINDAVALAEQLGGASAINGEQQRQLVNELLRTVEQNATVTEEGEDEAGTHLRATLPLRETVQDIMDAIPDAGMGTAEMEQSLQDVPDADVPLDFWISDGTVSQIAFDVTEFAAALEGSDDEEFPEGVEEFSVVIAIEEFDGTIDPVADATAIDTAAVGQALSGMMTGGMGAGGGAAPGGGAFDCDMLKGAPPEVVELYAEECPELQK